MFLTESTLGNPGRRHDLDALRAFAMLLGIALHAALSFAQFPWSVQDTKQDGGFHMFFFAVHGFRMPLFFLLSGFFTAMLWQKRGLASLLMHRTKRILLPLLLGLVTVIPILNGVSDVVANGNKREVVERLSEKLEVISEPKEVDYSALAADADPRELNLLLEAAAKEGNVDALGHLIAKGADLNLLVDDLGAPLHWAAALGHVEAVEYLIGKGANLDIPDTRKSTPLHWASFLGKPRTVEVLIKNGADLNVQNSDGSTPLDSVSGDWNQEIAGITAFIASILDIKIDLEKVKDARPVVRDILEKAGAGYGEKKDAGEGLLLFLFLFPIFHHLWFLWFLCWLVAFFAVFAWVRSWFPSRDTPRWILLLLAAGLVVLTFGPQSAMRGGGGEPGFGPDTSIGLLPFPHLLAYYAIFFFFGALYFNIKDVHGRLGKFWWVSLPLALFVLFPAALYVIFDPEAALHMNEDDRRGMVLLLEVAFTWLMICGCIGLFQSVLSAGNRFVRYLSDASYWLYLTHLPLVILLQWWVKDWDLPALVKFGIVLTGTTGSLLAVYHFAVRYSWLGTLLNGPRSRELKA